MKRILLMAVMCFGMLNLALAQGRGGGGHPSGPPSGSGSSAGSMGSGMGNSTSNTTASGHKPSGADATTDHKPSNQDLLNQNTKLSSNLQKLLPAGTTPQQACSGFKNLGECVAAIHVSKNLGISFDDLKNKMTGASAENLGNAIHDLNPNVDAKAEKKKAEKQAKEDIHQS